MKELLRYLFGVCGIDASEDTAPEEALKLIKQALGSHADRIKDDAVAEAIAARKLRPDEKDWALDFAGENFAAFRAFLKLRKPIPPAVMALASRLAKPVVPDALDATTMAIMKQMGVSRETYLKYNSSESKDSAGIDATQEAFNKKMGLSRETFLKYCSPSKAGGV